MGADCSKRGGRGPRPPWKQDPPYWERMRREPSRLTSMSIPDIRLGSFRRGRVSLSRLAEEPLVIYMYPGTLSAPGEGKQTPRLDRTQHRGYLAHHDELSDCGYKAVGISSQAPREQASSIGLDNLRHELLSDPDMLLADALGVPSFRAENGTRAYHRLTLVARGGVIQQAFVGFYPAHNAAQVCAWLRLR
jgi:peroxiredoxin